MKFMKFWRGDKTRLVRATLQCRLCARPVGDLVGYPQSPMSHARFIPLRTGILPMTENGELRCSHCHGQLELDDVEELGRSVTLTEVGGAPFARVIARADSLRMQAQPAA